MERYERYKDSGVKWIGEIPGHWGMYKLKYLFKLNKNKNIGNKCNTILSLSYGKIKIKKDLNEGLTPESYESYQLLSTGDIVIRSTDLQNDHTSLRTGLVKIEGAITSAYIGLKNLDMSLCDSRFYHYFLHDWDITKAIYNQGKGLRQSLNWDDIKNMLIPVLDISEQTAIANYLDSTTAKIDEAIAQQQKMIDLLNERKQIIINNAVTKGLNPDAPMKDSGVDWIGEIPEHWEVMPIKRLKSKEKNAFVDGPFGSNLKSEHFVENGDVYVIESGLITTGKYVHRELKTITKSHFDTIKRSECKANDIIIAKIGARFGMAGELPELGKPCVVSGNSLKLTLDQSVMQNGMFVNYMGLAKWKGGFVGLYQETAQPALSLGALNNMMLPVPPIEEQLYILEQTNQKLDILDVAIINASKQISLLQERKQIIINDVVTGKVKVS